MSPRLSRLLLLVTAFAAVSSQFGGVPLAFFFISTVGTVGVVTKLLHDVVGFDLYAHGFTAFGFWGIFEKETGARIGEAGILDVKRDIVPSFHGTPELGWGLLPAVHGKGYATEAVRAIIAWAEGHFGKVRMVCIIDPQNTASLRVAHACGFRECAQTTYKGDPTVILERVG